MSPCRTYEQESEPVSRLFSPLSDKSSSYIVKVNTDPVRLTGSGSCLRIILLKRVIDVQRVIIPLAVGLF